MANTFKNYTKASIGTTGQSVYTVPSSTTSVMIGLNLSNTATTQVTVDVLLNGTYIVKNVPIPSGSSLDALGGKIILETGDNVVVESDTANSLDVILSVLEQT